MIRKTIRVGEESLDVVRGAVLCRDLPINGNGHARARTIRRGTPIDDALITTLSPRIGTVVDALSAEPGEIDQSTASLRAAQTLAGPGVELSPPHQGQCILKAKHNGLLRVNQRAVIEANVTGTLLVATGLDGRVVQTGDTLAIIKAAQLWVREAAVNALLGRLDLPAAIRVVRFQVTKAAFLAGRRIRPGNFNTAKETLRTQLATFGVELTTASHATSDRVEEIEEALQRCLADGAELILVAGSIVLDPADPFIQIVERISGTSIQSGAPIDPGTMFWAAQTSRFVLFGLASCELYGRLSILDLLLPYAIAREPIDRQLLAELGYGGLLEQTFTARRSVPSDFNAR